MFSKQIQITFYPSKPVENPSLHAEEVGLLLIRTRTLLVVLIIVVIAFLVAVLPTYLDIKSQLCTIQFGKQIFPVSWVPSSKDVLFSSEEDAYQGFAGTAVSKKSGGFIPKLSSNSDLKAEAVAAFNVALEMKANGKLKKASKLFKHALNLDPLHVDILVEYGRILEEQKDIILADLMYARALMVSPSHELAQRNHKRTLPLVEELDQRYYNMIDKKRELLLQVPDTNLAFKRAKKESYFQHIYHTNAIEGNTLNLIQTRTIVETRMAIAGKSIVEHNEVLGLDAALQFLDSSLLQKIGRITVDDILALHKRVLGFVDPMEAGVFRKTQVYVGEFAPPKPELIITLMQEFVEWLNSAEALSLHPIEYAALVHYKLVYIHPFIDGNGRTSRLLMNLALMQAGYPPVIIKVDDRLDYYEHLREGNRGDVRPFIRFVAKCTEQTIDEYLHQVVSGQSTPHHLEITGKDVDRTIILEDKLEREEYRYTKL